MTASITDLRRRTSELIDEVKKGNEVRIQSHGHPVARLIPDAEPDVLQDPEVEARRRKILDNLLAQPQGPIDRTDIILDDRRRKADELL